MVETQLSLVVRTADFESFDLNQAFRERNGVRTGIKPDSAAETRRC